MFDMDYYFYLRDNNKIKEAYDYRIKFIPTYLYKYYSLNNSSELNDKKLSTLSNNQIWLSRGSEMNDPFEFKSFYLEHENLNKLFKGKCPKYIYDFLITSVEIFDNTTYITCFSDSMINSMPMWAHYTNNHQGYCVKYELLEKQNMYKVMYEERRVQVAEIFFKLAMDFYPYSNFQIPKNERTEMLHFLNFRYFIKHKSWEYENEYRIVLNNIKDKENGFSMETSQAGIKPVQIYAGINCTDENKKTLNKISKKLKLNNLINIKTSSTQFILEY